MIDYSKYNKRVITDVNENLAQIPPLNGRIGMRYNYPGIASAEFTIIGATRQDKVGDNETETGGYARYDLAMSSSNINLGPTRLKIFAGIENITDRSYTNHLATNRGGISVEPGRNIYMRLSLSF